MLDLYKLQIFAVVAQEGSFSAAAERLFMTQSAVSQHIKDLEAGLGRPLFERGRRGVTLTAHGEVLNRYAGKIFALLAEAETALTDVGHLTSGRLSIGVTPGIAVYLAPDWVQKFRARYPQITVAMQTGTTPQVVAEALAHRLDLGFVEGEIDDLSHAHLQALVLEEVEQQVVVGFKHPFWEAERATIQDLKQQSLLVRQANSHSRLWLERTLRQHGVEPLIGAEFDNLESMKRAVAIGTCLAVLPPYVVQSEVEQGLLHVVPMEGRPFVRSLRLIRDSSVVLPPIARAFLAEMADHFSALAPLVRQEADPSTQSRA